MVSVMESKHDLAAQLLAVERSEAAPYVCLRPSPRWYPPAVGLWAATLFVVITWELTAVALLALVALECAFLRWMVRRQGAWPRAAGPKPPEITREYSKFLVGLVPLALLLVLTTWLAGRPAGLAIVLVGVTAGIALYERSYERAAARVRARLHLSRGAS